MGDDQIVLHVRLLHFLSPPSMFRGVSASPCYDADDDSTIPPLCPPTLQFSACPISSSHTRQAKPSYLGPLQRF